jgi:SpoVK/Ycf46/Vps4 family AAA+-type ATPase
MVLLKQEHDPSKKQILRNEMSSFLSFAEKLKAKLQGSSVDNNSSNSKSSNGTNQSKVRPEMKQSVPQSNRNGVSVSNHNNSNKLQGVPEELAKMIENDILDTSQSRVTFDDIVGLKDVKQALQEMVILPSLRPDLFSGTTMLLPLSYCYFHCCF